MKKKILDSLYEENLYGIKKYQLEILISSLFQKMQEIILSEGNFQIKNLGSFSIKQRKELSLLMPNSKEMRKFPPKLKLKFHPSRSFEKKINQIR